MAEELKLDRRQVAGLFMELMEWADENTVDGNVRGVTKAFPICTSVCAGLRKRWKKLDGCGEKDGIFFVGSPSTTANLEITGTYDEAGETLA